MMKYLLLVVTIGVVLWLARGGRRSIAQRPESAKPNGLPPQEDMVACAQCGVHIPRSEALVGREGVFCSAAHRAAFKRAQT